MIIHGDSLEKLKDIESESVDLLCTDPPYGYSFMGKSWDKTLPDIGVFKECYRVLKPGAFAFVMSAPRSDVCARMMLLLEDSGFNIGFTPIYWTYASGFPKAMNIGKMVDKRRDDLSEYAKVSVFVKRHYQASGLSHAEMDEHFGIKNVVQKWCTDKTSGVFKPRVPTWEQWLNLKDKLLLSDEMDEEVWRLNGRKGQPGEAWFEREVLQERKQDVGGNGIYGDYSGNADITAPATDAAKALDGSYGGFQPKPAVEVIIVAMKPLSERTYVDQALKRVQQEENILKDIETRYNIAIER